MHTITLFDSNLGDIKLTPGLIADLPGAVLGAVENLSISMAAGESLGGHRLVQAGVDGRVVYADKDNGRGLMGMTLGAALTGSPVRIAVSGIVREVSWSWDMSSPLFLGNNGLITQTPPTTGLFCQVAKPLLPDTILISLLSPINLA